MLSIKDKLLFNSFQERELQEIGQVYAFRVPREEAAAAIEQ